jgi:ribose transport system substrate-binding protein
MAGEWVLKKLGDAGGNVVEIMGLIGTSAQIERHEGFVEAISANPSIKILSSKPADWTRDKAITVMEEMLREFPKIDVVFAHNDFSALGAYTAAENVGREDEMAFMGVDGLITPDGGIVGIMEGKIDVTYLYPTGAKEAIESCYKLLVKGEPLKKELMLGTIEITRDNVQIYIDESSRRKE